MLLFNEKNELLDVEDVTAELKNLNDVSTPTLEEVQTVLGNYYQQALQLQATNLQMKAELTPLADAAPEVSFLGGLGGNILAEIKKIICPLLNGTSTEDQIIQAVLSALATIIPGGIFIKTLANIIVKFLLSTGISNFCAV